MKKILSLGVISLVMLSTLSPLASAMNDGRRLMGSGSAGSGKVIDLACAKDAVLAREAAIKSAYIDLSSSLTQGLDTRAKELDSAWSMENAANRRVARDAAWSNWRTSSKTARDTFRTARKSTWDTYRTAMKSCNASGEVESTMLQNQDVQ